MTEDIQYELTQLKSDLKLLATKEDLKQFATKEDLKQFATKDDQHGLEEKIDLKFPTKEHLFQTKVDLIKWMFTFWISIVLMVLGLYLRK